MQYGIEFEPTNCKNKRMHILRLLCRQLKLKLLHVGYLVQFGFHSLSLLFFVLQFFSKECILSFQLLKPVPNLLIVQVTNLQVVSQVLNYLKQLFFALALLSSLFPSGLFFSA